MLLESARRGSAVGSRSLRVGDLDGYLSSVASHRCGGGQTRVRRLSNLVRGVDLSKELLDTRSGPLSRGPHPHPEAKRCRTCSSTRSARAIFVATTTLPLEPCAPDE